MLEAKDLRFAYPSSQEILKGISLKIAGGSRIAVVGENGSGKTTLARLLCGLLKPTGGKVFLDGMDTQDPDAVYHVRRRVGLAFQDPDDQLVETTVEREIGFGPRNLGLEAEEVKCKVDRALEVFELGHLRRRPCHLLSAGEKQMVNVASIFVMSPDYVILDESTSLLDWHSRLRVLASVERLLEETGAGLVLVSMRLEDVWRCDRVVFLEGGRADFEGSREDLLAYLRSRRLPIHGLGLLVSRLEEAIGGLGRRLSGWRELSADCLSEVLLELGSKPGGDRACP